MNENMSLGKFIKQVKEELISARDSTTDPFLELVDVDLEVAFALETKAGAKGKLVVLEMGGEAATSETHKVKLKLRPLKQVTEPQSLGETKSSSETTENEVKYEGGGGAGGFLKKHEIGVVYNKMDPPEDIGLNRDIVPRD